MAERRVARKLLDSPLREAARSAGLRKFTSPHPCKHGHTERRVSNGMCAGCCNLVYALNPEPAKARQIQRRLDYPEVFKARNAKYRAENKDKCQAGEAKWRKLNPEKVKCYALAYYYRNQTSALEYKRSYRLKNKPRAAITANIWRMANMEKTRVIVRNRRARLLAAPGTHTATEVQAKLKKQGGKCYYCFKKLKGKQHVDHYIALINGGHNDIANLNISCIACNSQKHASHPLDFIRRKFNRLL